MHAESAGDQIMLLMLLILFKHVLLLVFQLFFVSELGNLPVNTLERSQVEKVNPNALYSRSVTRTHLFCFVF